MIFLLIVIIAIGLYVRDHKISALVLFFLFLTSGFNLIPEEMTQIPFFSKGMDYAIVMLFVIAFIDVLCVRGYLKPNCLIYLYLLFCAYLAVCIFYNKSVIGVDWTDIIRTCRYHSLWLVYLVFRHLSKARTESLLKCLFLVTVVCSVLFILQIFLNVMILNEGAKGWVDLFGMKIRRYYNQPDMLHFFVFIAIYCNPLKGAAKRVTTTILVIALLAAFHRSLIGSFLFAVVLGYIIQRPRLQRIRMLTIASVFSVFFIVFAGYMFVHSRTYIDIQHIISGGFVDMEIDTDELHESTFTFRIMHLIERNQYLLDNPVAMITGAGLMAEDSKLTYSMFDFDVGLAEELSGQTQQLDTGDISYSVLLLRYGYLGTFLNLALFIYLMVFFYKKRKHKYGLASFLFLVMSFGTSFFSSNLVMPITFVLPLLAYRIVEETDAPPQGAS